jgi:predicted PurR-regulated permease PerM
MNDDDESFVSALRTARVDGARVALWLATGVIVVGLWLFLWDTVQTLILGLFVYYVTRPVFARVHGRVPNRTLATGVSIVLVALPVLVLVGWVLAIAVQVVPDLLSPEAREQVAAVVAPLLDLWSADVETLVRTAAADPGGLLRTDLGLLATAALDGLFASLAVVARAGLEAFIVLVVTFYLLRDDYRIAAWGRRTVAREDGVVETYLVAVDRDLQNVFFGNVLNALLTGLLAVVTYLLLNVVAPPVVVIPEAALFGLLVGAASLVPAVGIKLVTLPLGAYLLARSALLDPSTLWFPALFLVVSFVVVDYIPDQLLRPYVSGRRLHVGAIMLAYLFGPLLFGWYGIFLGPFLLVVVFEFGRIVVPWLVGAEDLPEELSEPPDEEAPEESPAPPEESPAPPEESSADPVPPDDRPEEGAT